MNRKDSMPSCSRCGILLVGLAWVAALLACALPTATAPVAPTAVAPTEAPAAVEPTQDPSIDLTRESLSVQATVLAVKEATLQAGYSQATSEAGAAAAAKATDQAGASARSTEAAQAAPTAKPPEPTTSPAPTPTVDMEAKLKASKILLFEDTPTIGLWVKEALDGAGYKYTNVGDAVGKFMENLNSGIKWDLIVIAAESKSGVRGEFWDVMLEQANRDVAIVAEVWYLDSTVNGRIRPFLTSCGIDFQRDQPTADSIYWLEPTHPVFNQPNTAMPLLHYSRYWANQSGDLIELLPGSNATMLAGIQKNRSSDYGQIATCMEGRVIFQTFSNHDYPRSEVMRLWQNYFDYTLRNHYLAVEK